MIDSSIGVCVSLPNCTFKVEIPRSVISNFVIEIDKEFKNLKDNIDKVSSIMMHSLDVSKKLIKNDINQETGVAEISYSFIYAFVKEKGFETLKDIRGIVGMLADDKLYLNPCLDEKSFQIASDEMFEMTNENDTIDISPPKPTIH